MLAGVTAKTRQLDLLIKVRIMLRICISISGGWSPTAIFVKPGKSIRVKLRTKRDKKKKKIAGNKIINIYNMRCDNQPLSLRKHNRISLQKERDFKKLPCFVVQTISQLKYHQDPLLWPVSKRPNWPNQYWQE